MFKIIFQSILVISNYYDSLCGLRAAYPEVPGSIPGATGFSEK
jgi:hypothetical protein